jgi:hypothetical protein
MSTAQTARATAAHKRRAADRAEERAIRLRIEAEMLDRKYPAADSGDEDQAAS